MRSGNWVLAAAGFALALLPAKSAHAQYPYRIIYPGQRTIEYRDPSAFAPIPLPPSSPPPTVSAPPTGDDTRYFALDDAIRIALANDRVIRVLTGISATASGRTIYDPAIVNTTIDEQLGRFDPFVSVESNWDHLDIPSAVFLDENNPALGSAIVGTRIDRHRLNVAVTKENPLGGQWRLGVDSTRDRFPFSVLPLNPETTSSADLSYTQPLLQGFGRPANLAPVVLARIDTERSFFQLKQAVQEQVRGVIEAYWNLVSARTTVVARRKQVEISQLGMGRANAQFEIGLTDRSGVSQARSTLAQFQAQLVAAEADVLQFEAALRNLLGLPPWDGAQLIPTTEPIFQRFEPNWAELVDLAAQRRPDLVELKLILEADEQQLIIANNNALPQLNAVALYRWNGLQGEMPDGNGLASGPGQFTDWTLGVNFSVPVGLRTARAQLRSRELILARDQANLDQGLHAASHDLATTLRSLAQAYEQFLAFQDARNAAQLNLDQQFASGGVGRIDGLVVRQAIADLGNSIASEAQAVANYNTLLAELELQTGTILETHGIRFYEERYGSIGPLGRHARPACFPLSTPPTPNADRYPPGERPAERSFRLEDLDRLIPRQDLLPPLPPPTVPPPGLPAPGVPQPLPPPRER
jgi:outer membrane protein TolC